MSDPLLTLRIRIAGTRDARQPWGDNASTENAAIGKRIVAAASQQLTEEFAEGLARRSRYPAIRLPQLFPDEGIVSALSTQWGAHRAPKGGEA
jgi:hypothetical protein